LQKEVLVAESSCILAARVCDWNFQSQKGIFIVIQNLFAKLFLKPTPKPTTLATFDCGKNSKVLLSGFRPEIVRYSRN